MYKDLAGKLWAELNYGMHPKELGAVPLDTLQQRWELMEKLAPLASKKAVDARWNELCGITNSDCLYPFGFE